MVVRRERGGGQCGQQQGRDNCLSHDRVPAFGSGVPRQRLIVAPRGAGGDARKRIPVIKKITNLRAQKVFSLPAIARIRLGVRRLWVVRQWREPAYSALMPEADIAPASQNVR
jgi:hypothetical protein